MSTRIYHVNPTPEEKERLDTIAYTGTHPVWKVVVARLLLKVAAGESDADIAKSLDIVLSTVATTRKRFHTEGLEACLTRREQKNRFRKITGDVEARIAQVACTQAPEGRARWTLDLLAERIVELSILPSVGRTTVARALKKTKSSPGATTASASRPSATANS